MLPPELYPKTLGSSRLAHRAICPNQTPPNALPIRAFNERSAAILAPMPAEPKYSRSANSLLAAHCSLDASKYFRLITPLT